MQAAHSAAVADGLIPELNGKNKGGEEETRQGDVIGETSVTSSKPAECAPVHARVAPVHAPLAPRPAAPTVTKTMTNVQTTRLPTSLRNENSGPYNVAGGGGVSALADAAAKSSPVIATSPPSHAAQSSNKKKGPPLRRGKWTQEEEAYANRLIQEFKAGLLPLTDGTTLRTFLSKLLNCDPMRISKKFVGSNCIGKQVFRRRTAEINRLNLEQIQQSRAELSELERRFLDRVAQTNRVKTTGGPGVGASVTSVQIKVEEEHENLDRNTDNPPWLRPPNGYKPGAAAAAISAAASALGHSSVNNTSTNNRAAAAGRALLQGSGVLKNNEERKSNPSLSSSASHGSAGLLALAELHRRRSQEKLLQAAASVSRNAHANNLLNSSFSGTRPTAGLSSAAMAQIARNASAAKIASLAASNNSINNLMLKHGLSREQLGQLAREQQLSSSRSLSNLVDKKSSFDALMSLDFQSLQSIDNLANLIQSGGGLSNNNIPNSGFKNWSMEASSHGSGTSLSGLTNARRLASEGRMESLIRTLSSGNVGSRSGLGGSSGGSNANFGNLLQSMQSLNSAASLLGSGNNLSATNAMSLANLLRNESATGLTALRMQDGLAQRNSSVDDFLSLVASGDIPHQDPHLLNLPLQTMLQQQQAAQQNSGAQAAATLLAQQQFLAQAANKSLGNLSAASLLNQISNDNSTTATNAVAFAQQQQQARAAQMNMSASALAAARLAAHQHQKNSSGSLKRKYSNQDITKGLKKR